MIESFSPFTRRVLAIGLLILALLVAGQLFALIASGVGNALDRLQDSRFALARVEAVRTRPPPPRAAPLPPGQFIGADSHGTAAAAAAGRIRTAAGQSGVTLEAMAAAPVDPLNPKLVRLTFAARAAEPALLGFLQTVERDDPPLRLNSWSISRAAPDSPELILQASAVTAWSPAQ